MILQDQGGYKAYPPQHPSLLYLKTIPQAYSQNPVAQSHPIA